ncbi:MAG: 5'/3'-nucleotidase SurE [Chitinophagaceae bacterium]|jgi:5'-nucleotidase
MQEKPIILITNDDSIYANGIKALAEAALPFGRVVVVAPNKPQSGMGHAITINQPLRINKVNFIEGVEAYTTDGTPVDCIKLAVDKILHRKPDVCLSGINHGANHSINVIYSGTMSAAMEAAIEGIPSIGFSLLDYDANANFTLTKKVVATLLQQYLQRINELDEHLLLNVNIPKINEEDFKGIKMCRQAYAKYNEDFIERQDPHGNNYYWLTGVFNNKDEGTDTDVWALANNYASVVPVTIDFTDYKNLKTIQNWNL